MANEKNEGNIEKLSKHRAKLPVFVQLEHTHFKILEIEAIRKNQETVSKPDDYVVERKSEVESIVGKVIEANKHQLNSIVPVFGMGGLGKTTLARSVFNHEAVKTHFDILVWIYVSEPLVINNILQAILHKVEDNPSDYTNNMEALLGKLTKN